MADADEFLREKYAAAPATGTWEDQPSALQQLLSYFRAQGQRMADKPRMEHLKEAEIVGPFVRTGEDMSNRDWGSAGLHGLEALLGIGTGGRSSSITKGGRAAAAYLPELQAALARSEALNSGVALTGKTGKPLKANGAAWQREFEKAYPGAKGAPPAELSAEAARTGRPLQEVADNFAQLNQSGPVAKGVAGASLAGAPFAPLLDDKLGSPVATTADVLKQAYQDVDQTTRDHREPHKSYRLDDPHIRKIYEDMARTNNVLSGHIGAGAAMSAATPALAKLGWRGVQGWMLPLAAELGMIHPALGIAAAAPAVATMLPAAGTAYGAYKTAMDTGPLRDRALALKELLDEYARKGHDRFGPEAQASYPREGE